MALRSQSIVVMGVCGVGKSTVARRLAEVLGGLFIEGDDYHSTKAITAMSNGIPIDDEDRIGWLERIGDAMNAHAATSDTPAVVACSALKKIYRDLLRARVGQITFIFLDGTPDLIRSRLEARSDHFMPVALLESQFGDLETPKPGEDLVKRFDVARSVDEIVEEAIAFHRSRHDPGEEGGEQQHSATPATEAITKL